jgi:hypothetical protein
MVKINRIQTNKGLTMHSTLVKTRLLTGFSLLVLLLASCAPEAVATEQPTQQPVAAEPSATAFLPVEEPTIAAPPNAAISPTEAVAPFPVATSRGPDLEATNPSTVSLAAGNLQFVEFFRFT